MVAIGLGGLVSMAILVTGASIPGNELTRPMDLASGLQPLFGNAATFFTGIGLFAAGITSSITAPYAAAIVIQSCFGWKGGMDSKKFRASWMIILLIGLASTTLSFSPIVIIQFAQLANGILLPIMAALLWWLSASKQVLGIYRNGKILNLVSFFLLLTTVILSIRTLSKVLF
jgi:Mn2+/Fe2+ NRAMP family transporter